MVLSRVLASFVVVAAAVVGAGAWAAAGAQTYATGMSVSNDRPPPGAQIIVRASGLVPNSSAHVLFDSVTVATTAVDANGIAAKSITVPPTTSTGEHLVTLTDLRPAATPRSFSKPIDVNDGGIAFTHADATSTRSFVWVSLLIGGPAALLLWRRRSAPQAP